MRNEAKQKMYESKSNIAINLNVLKLQLPKDGYDILTTITDNTKEKHFIEQEEHLIWK